MDKEIELKDLKNLINNMKDTAIVNVDLRALISDENGDGIRHTKKR